MIWLWLLIIVLNGLVLLLFGSDKLLARLGWQRITERNLALAAMFGPVGAIIAMQVFRHKTRKTSFQHKLILPLLIGFVVLSTIAYISLQN